MNNRFSMRSPTLTHGFFARVHSDYRTRPGIASVLGFAERVEMTTRKIDERLAMADQANLPDMDRRAAKLKTVTKGVSDLLEHGARAWTAIEEENAALTMEVRSSMQPPLGADQREYREGLWRLSAQDRSKVLEEALAAGPSDPYARGVFGAAILAPPYLTGLSANEQEVWRLRWTQAHSPDLLARKQAIEECQEKLEMVRRALAARVEEARQTFGAAEVEHAAALRASLEA